ncbi:tripartite tricarboxylate transporter TctB family protein [Brevibacterium sp. ZH18]|uniref:tripartite tricarboxylate transporter TctB family protein n=1 Tax=Brevibacterium sp. ZH18 TaxID=2927784 RepID=UPI001F619954|nr:tripartite tricarboxylate transporter TctB family protein [Brevibacterium sp. ZH18]MCI4010774.1 tripartite tricarboxylate transporter TctB family protein [Brevibacterium sp. ZH18]
MSTATDTEKIPPRNKPDLADVVGTSILGVVGGFAAIMGFHYGLTVEGGQVGPGMLPCLTGAFIFLASAAEIFRLFFARVGTSGGRIMSVVEDIEATAAESIDAVAESHPDDDSSGDLDTFGRTEKQRNRAPFYIFLTFGVALALIPVLGLIISLAAAILFLLLVVEKQKWWTSAATTIGAAVFVYIVFGLVLSVPMPTGLLGLI